MLTFRQKLILWMKCSDTSGSCKTKFRWTQEECFFDRILYYLQIPHGLNVRVTPISFTSRIALSQFRFNLFNTGQRRFQLIRQVFGDSVFAHPDGLVNIPQRVLDNSIIL